MSAERKYWFPAKRYGWGWGIPQCWQGWLVLLGFAVLIGAGTFFFPPAIRPGAYFVFSLSCCGLLVGICWLTGEPPRWRWGDEDRS